MSSELLGHVAQQPGQLATVVNERAAWIRPLEPLLHELPQHTNDSKLDRPPHIVGRIHPDDLFEERERQAARASPPAPSTGHPNRKVLLFLLADVLPEVVTNAPLTGDLIHLHAVLQHAGVVQLA